MADTKTSDATATATATDTKTGDTKAADTKAADTKTADAAAADGKVADTKIADTKTGDTKATDTKTAADTKTTDGAPEKYELAIPKGAETWLDPTDVQMIETIARANHWTKEQAQSRLEEHVDALVAQSQQFQAQTKADPTYGGEKLVETQRLAQLVLDRVRPTGHPRAASFRALLAKTGYGNHLEVVSFLADLGALLAEDQTASGRATGGGKTERSLADKMYGGSAA